MLVSVPAYLDVSKSTKMVNTLLNHLSSNFTFLCLDDIIQITELGFMSYPSINSINSETTDHELHLINNHN